MDGKYRIEGFVGRGGMGIVTEATHVLLEQRVAVKFPKPELVERGDAARRFLREARVAFGVKGEHVVRVLDLGLTAAGCPFIAMEYLDGKTVGELHREREKKWSVAQAAQITMQAARGVAAAHAVGLVHRDLKPSNLFVVRGARGDAVIKVLDFGLAVPLTDVPDAQSITGSGAVVGSPVYMSPEQARGEDTDDRCDVWALGVILYELLAGAPPFSAANPAAAMGRILVDPPPPLRSKNPEVPAALEKVILRCLRKAPEERYGSADEVRLAIAGVVPEGMLFIEELGGVRTGSQASAAMSSGVTSTFVSRTLTGQSGIRAPRRRWLLVFAAAALLTVVVLAGLRAGQSARRAATANETGQTANERPSEALGTQAPAEHASLKAPVRVPPPPERESQAAKSEAPAPSALPTTTSVTVRRKPRRAPAPDKNALPAASGEGDIESAIETRR